jgi:hypothetical protein
MVELPDEIWTQIFDLAVDEDVIFQYWLPTSMAECAWFRHISGDHWVLRTPQEALNLVQRRSYFTKKVSIFSRFRTRSNWPIVNHNNMQKMARVGSRIPLPLPVL